MVELWNVKLEQNNDTTEIFNICFVFRILRSVNRGSKSTPKKTRQLFKECNTSLPSEKDQLERKLFEAVQNATLQSGFKPRYVSRANNKTQSQQLPTIRELQGPTIALISVPS